MSGLAVALLFFCSSISALEFAVVSYNVESDGDTEAEQVAQDIARIPASHLWALSEVNAEDFDAFKAAIGEEFAMVQGTTGGSDRLAIVYDPEILTPVADPIEFADAGGSRHPLFVRFRVAATNTELYVVATHLQRGNSLIRESQARWLNQWVSNLTRTDAPPAVLLLGDFNFDVEPSTERGNTAYDLFLDGGVIRWIRPTCLDENNCPNTGTGCNPRYTSILDFVFLAGAAIDWSSSSEILFKEDAEYCTREANGGSDHRPIRALITLPTVDEE